jgi:DNA-binding beta-propeller fold protein YncE
MGRYPDRSASITEVQVSPLRLNWITTLGGPGSNAGQFFEPRDVAVLSNGYLVVADTINRRVQILDAQGNPSQVLTGNEFPFEEPLAVAVNSQDEILILDSTLQWVYRYDAAGNFFDRFGGPTAYLFHPRGMNVFEDDTIGLADTGSSRLAFFTPAGIQAGSIGGAVGDGPGEFNEPTDLLRDVQGTYFVVEAMNNRIQRVDPVGNSLAQWAIPPAYAFDGPHLAFGPDESIFMTESQSHSLLRYAPDGTMLDQWQTIGPIKLVAPVGVYFDPSTNRLYLTDVKTHQVHVFEVQGE